ncbi:TetR/AcrR family transcriptional regulator [Clostridium sp. JS66]|uniref:TetR/AcrR family transcriptional regulator n=1 Tax=Clostridium sp. JS66 TaxID=3064705 RepID=UPI00298E7A4D|nr:TetR/AcrR family transcriptional regulator [Clostridium sp. JS66]WPC43348.1 TetR/AcrR family transcriptional regulator [Clostridium sp. JS66]
MIIIDNEFETREKLLISAKQEFLKNGFEKASLRTICKNVGLTTGALYFFFKNKEDIFDCIVKDVAIKFKNMIYAFAQKEKIEYQSALSAGKANTFSSDIDHEKDMMKYIYANKDAFVLLAIKAQGSSYESYYCEIVKFLEQLFGEFFQLYHGKEIINSKMTQYAIHCMVSWRMHSYLEILQNNLTLEEVLIQAEIVANYAIGGFERVMNNIR